MVSSVIENPTDVRTDRQCVVIGMSLEEHRYATVPMPAEPLTWLAESELARNRFATVPMAALHPTPVPWREREEEWHTAFEQAISERAARISQRLQRLTTAGLEAPLPVTDPLPAPAPVLPGRARQFWRVHKRVILLCCLGLSLFLLGFDLMGLLMLVR